MSGLVIRHLKLSDKHQFLEVLSDLTDIGIVEGDIFFNTFSKLTTNPDHHILVCLIDDRVVGTATVLVRPTFIHSCRPVAHIEEVVTLKQFEGLGIATSLMREMEKIAAKRGCYKCILSCSEQNRDFYKKLGYHLHEDTMRKDF